MQRTLSEIKKNTQTTNATEVIIHWMFYVPTISQYQHSKHQFCIPLRVLINLNSAKMLIVKVHNYP